MNAVSTLKLSIINFIDLVEDEAVMSAFEMDATHEAVYRFLQVIQSGKKVEVPIRPDSQTWKRLLHLPSPMLRCEAIHEVRA